MAYHHTLYTKVMPGDIKITATWTYYARDYLVLASSVLKTTIKMTWIIRKNGENKTKFTVRLLLLWDFKTKTVVIMQNITVKNDGIELTADFVVISSPLLISYSVYFSSTKKKLNIFNLHKNTC